MTSHHATEPDSNTPDSVTSTPRSDHHHRLQDDTTSPPQRLRLMCSFGGKILPRPHDNQLRYVGGDTRIVTIQRHSSTFSSLLNTLSKLSGATNISVKYQLPNEDLDALITVAWDEDVENMMEEYDRLARSHNAARLRLFLFDESRAHTIGSLLGGSAKREHWFLDALNGGSGSGLERGRSEASSIVSEVPDYLFGLDNNSDDLPRDLKQKSRIMLGETVQGSDPGSPAPIVSSPFSSVSSLAPAFFPSIPDLPPLKTRPENPGPVFEEKEAQVEGMEMGEPVAQHQTKFVGKPMWNYVSDPHYPNPVVQQIPFYYLPGSVRHGSVPMHAVPVGTQYVQQFPPPPGQVPIGFSQSLPGMVQVYGRGMRLATAVEPYDMSARMVPDGVNQALYYGIRNAGVAPAYPGVVVPGGEEFQGTESEANVGRVSQPSS